MKRTISMILAIVMMLGMFCMTASAENATLAALDIQMLDGASIRVGTVAGIRYSTLINKAQLDALTENNTVEIGTIIAPTQYVTDAGAFTMAALDQFKTENNIENATYVKVPATVGTPLKTVTVDETEYYVYAGSLENIKDANQTLAFSGIGYVKIGEDVVYATYNNTNSRSVGYVAYRAYMDPDFKAEFGTDGQGLIDDFANAFLTATLGAGAPDSSTVRYFEGYDDMANTADFADATTFLGWKDNFVYNGKGTGYVYGKDVKAKYADGKLVFQTTNTAREGHMSETEYTTSNTLNAATQDALHSLLTIPGLNDETLFAGDNDTFVLQFDMKVTNNADDCGIGIAYCDNSKANFSRGRFVTASAVSWMFCSATDNTTTWRKKPGSVGTLCDPDATVVRVQFVISKDMTVQKMILNGTAASEGILANADQVSGDFDIGLVFFKAGTIEVDNLLVYSDKAEAAA